MRLIVILQVGESSDRAAVSLIGVPAAVWSWNLTGSLLPEFTVVLGSGDRKPPNRYPTTYGHDWLVVLPALSVAVNAAVFGPRLVVSAAAVSDVLPAMPEVASLAVALT